MGNLYKIFMTQNFDYGNAALITAENKCIYKWEEIQMNMLRFALNLKVVSATFLLVYFLCPNESTCETRKNDFHFTSKTLFIPEIIKF